MKKEQHETLFYKNMLVLDPTKKLHTSIQLRLPQPKILIKSKKNQIWHDKLLFIMLLAAKKKNGSETWEMNRTARITFPQIFID